MNELLTLIAIVFILILTLAILYVFKSFVNSSVNANEAILNELRELRKVLEEKG